MGAPTINCPGCGESTVSIAPKREKTDDGEYVYRGMIQSCKNGGCSHSDTAIAQTPITLCPHPETKRVPGHEHIEYCSECGVLSPDSQDDYWSQKPPWNR